jgi:hypothetical protein
MRIKPLDRWPMRSSGQVPFTTTESQHGRQATDGTQNPMANFCAAPRVQIQPSHTKAGSRPRFIYRQASFALTFLFLLIFSGPPKFRIRDPEASLRGDVDWVVVLHLLVWGLAGGWVLFQIAKPGQARLLWKRLSLPQKLGLMMIFCLAISVAITRAPALSAFKICQMAISLIFVQLYSERCGHASCLKTIFWGTALLCVALAACAFLAPDLVWIASDFNPDPSRLVGYLITPTGPVAIFGIILLLTGVRKIWRFIPLTLLVFFGWLLALSLMRTAYLVALGFFVLILIKHPNAKSLRQLAYLGAASAFILSVYHWLPRLSQYRQPEDIANLGDRIGLWGYLTHITLTQSPWWGLGYYSASRVYGPQYNSGLGNAHSMFFEILLGGGVLSFALFTTLCVTLSLYATFLLFKNRNRFSFAVACLFFAALVFGSMGEDIDSGPVAMCLWYSAAALPWICKRSLRRAARREELYEHLPMKVMAVNER